MTKEELRVTYLEWIEDYCNDEFDIGDLPGGIKLALDNLTELDPLSFNVSSEKLSDMSQTFTNDGSVPKFIYNWLSPYRKLRW